MTQIKKITSILFLCIFFYSGSLFAQSDLDNIVIQGDKGKFMILNSVKGARPSDISPNGLYMTGAFGIGKSYIYNTVENTIEVIENDGTALYTNNEKFVAGNVNPTFVAENYLAATYNPVLKTWKQLPRLPDNTGDISVYGNTSSCHGISSGASPKVAGLLYQNLPGLSSVAYCGVLWQNDTIAQLLPSFFPPSTTNPSHNNGYGARPNAVSEDGNTAVGFGSNTITNTQRTPHIWRNGVTYYVGSASTDGTTDGGECFGTNADGTVVVGGKNGIGAVIWRWDGSKYNPEHIAPLPGYDGARLISVSEDEVAVGYMWNGLVVNNIPIAYTKATGIMDLRTFLWELYGINTAGYDVFIPAGISKDGRKIAVSGGLNGSFLSFYIELEETPINTRPLRFAAKQIKNTTNVALSWAKPYNNGKTVVGYNVYKDSVKVNSSLITELKYECQNTEVGQQTYTATAVFDDEEESKYSDPVKLQIIEVGGCYSVKRFESEVVYNKTVELNWGLPSSEITESATDNNSVDSKGLSISTENEQSDSKQLLLAPGVSVENVDLTATASQNQKLNLDYISNTSLLDFSKITFFKWNDFYYAGDFSAPTISCFDLRGNIVESFSIEGLPSVNSFTTDGKHVYVSCNTKYFYKIDLEERTILEQYRLDSIAQRVCYIPELDNGKGGFEIGSWNSSVFVNMEGERLSAGFDFTSVYATVYHKGKVYASEQRGKNYSEIREYNFADKQPTGLVFDVMSIPTVKTIVGKWGAAIGGLTLAVMEDSTIALAAVMQPMSTNNFAVFLELESMPGLKGFNLFRNGTKVNAEPLKHRTYSDIITEPGKYEYHVTYLSETGCESAISSIETANIYPIGTCHKIEDLTAEEIHGEAFLKWNNPQKDGNLGTLLGYNIYRDQEKINEDLVFYNQYRDKAPVGAEPLYRIEAFYDNSCVASDSISIQITRNGKCDAIHLLDLKMKPSATSPSQYNVDLKWDLPYYESLYPLTWGQDAAYTTIGFPSGEAFTVAIGFDSSHLEQFLDYKVVGIDFYLQEMAKIKPLVLIDEEVKYYQEASTKMREEAYNRVLFEQAIPLQDLKTELVVGYTVSDYTGNPVGVDYAPLVPGYGDLLSKTPLDMKSWAAANPGGNWAISILLAKDREVSTSSVASDMGTASTSNKESGLLDLVRLNKSQSNIGSADMKSMPLANIHKNNNTIKLLGFNVYRDGNKLNTEPIQNTQYSDITNLNAGDYYYSVGSLWSECDEVMSGEVGIGITSTEEDLANSKIISIYPNPASDLIHINGDFERAEIIDVAGRVLNVYESGVSSFSVRDLKSGVYVLRITDNGRLQNIRFVVK